MNVRERVRDVRTALSLLQNAPNRTIIANTMSLVGTTAITSVLGFAFWWLATQRFAPVAVGFASAAISAMLLLGTIGMLGFGTLLIAELPHHPGDEGALIVTTLSVAGLTGGLLGTLFALIATHLSADLRPLAKDGGSVALFASGVALTAMTMVLDQALIGLLRGDYQFWRNALFAVAKLLALLIVAAWLGDRIGLAIYATWLVGNLASMLALPAIMAARWRTLRALRPRWQFVRSVGRAAVGHHGLNIALQFPALALPLVVTTILSATINAYFYAAWMVAGFIFVGPGALTASLYAVGARNPADVARRVRFTLGLGIAGGVVANAVLLLGASQFLRIFGAAYAQEAGWALRVIGLGVFPVIIKDHYVTICRLHGRISHAMLWVALGAGLEVIAAGVGAAVGGLRGLSVFWLGALCIETTWMVRAVVAVARMETAVSAS